MASALENQMVEPGLHLTPLHVSLALCLTASCTPFPHSIPSGMCVLVYKQPGSLLLPVHQSSWCLLQGQTPDDSPSHLVALHVVDQSQTPLYPILSSTNTQTPQLPKNPLKA